MTIRRLVDYPRSLLVFFVVFFLRVGVVDNLTQTEEVIWA